MEGAKFKASLNDPTTVVGLRGAMFASAPRAAACPATAAGWAALGGLTFASAPSPFVFAPLGVVPDPLLANIMKLPLNLSRLEVNLTLGPTAGAGSGGRTPVRADIVRGFVFSNTSVTGGPRLSPMRTNGPFEGAAGAPRAEERTVDGERWLYLTWPDFSMDFGSKTDAGEQFKGSGTFDFSFKGPLVLRAPLGCPKDCGPHGRCKAGAGAATTPACECECGWAPSPRTGACTVAQGFCSIYGGAAAVGKAAAAAALPGAAAGAAGAASDAGAAGSGPAASGGACPVGFGYNVSTQACDRCAAGFSGAGCGTCADSAACAAKLGKPGATCASGLTFAERSRQKFYSCALSDPSIATVVGPVLAFSCSTAAPDGSRYAPGGGAGAAGGRSSAVAGAFLFFAAGVARPANGRVCGLCCAESLASN